RVDAFCHAYRRVHPALIFQGNRIVRRVCYDNRSFGYRSNHAPTHANLPYLLHLALDGRVAFALLEFLLHLAQRHFLPLVPLPVLEQIVGSGDKGEHRDYSAEKLKRQALRNGNDDGGIAARESLKPTALRPHQGCQHPADEKQLDQSLRKVRKRLLRENPSEGRRRGTS